jgi:hypothetical protein
VLPNTVNCMVQKNIVSSPWKEKAICSRLKLSNPTQINVNWSEFAFIVQVWKQMLAHEILIVQGWKQMLAHEISLFKVENRCWHMKSQCSRLKTDVGTWNLIVQGWKQMLALEIMGLLDDMQEQWKQHPSSTLPTRQSPAQRRQIFSLSTIIRIQNSPIDNQNCFPPIPNPLYLLVNKFELHQQSTRFGYTWWRKLILDCCVLPVMFDKTDNGNTNAALPRRTEKSSTPDRASVVPGLSRS